MTRHLLICLLLVTATLSAQDATLRTRWGVIERPSLIAPAITITSPTLQPSLTVSSSSLTVGGISETGSAPITAITWTNDRGGSGTATGTSPTWATAGGSGAQVVAQDSFSGSGAQALAGLTASPVEGTWSEVVNTLGASAIIQRSAGWVQMNSGFANGTAIAKLTPTTGITGTNYDVSVTLQDVTSADGDDGVGIIFGYVDASNYCAAMVYGAGAATDMYLVKRVAGVATSLGTPFNADPVNGDVLSIEVRGTGLTVKENGISRITATDGACDDSAAVGIGFGAMRVASDDAASRWHLDDFTVTDQDASSGAITLQSGVNIITVTATSASGTSSDVIAVTLAVSDTVAPVATILTPTANATFPTSGSSFSFGGSATDNTGVSTVAWTCATCTPTSGNATDASGTGSWGTWAVTGVTLASGANTIVVTATDAAANTGTDQVVVTYTAGDVTVPTLTRTTPTSGATYTTSSNPLTIGGTAADNVSVSLVRWTCDICIPGTATGTTAWTAAVTLAPGVNVISFYARDGANNESVVNTFTVTLDNTLTITTTSMGSGTQSVAYAATTLTRAGGTGPYTWTNNGAGTSLNDGDAQCAGLVISSAGVVSGTPSAIGTCDWTAKVTDNVAATDTQALSIIVRDPAAAGPHDYFNDLIARGDCYRAYSFRPQVGIVQGAATQGTADCSKPHWAAQLSSAAPSITYAPGSDTDPEKQDGAKVTIPQFITQQYVLTSSIDASTTLIPMVKGSGENNRGIKIDNEIMVINGNYDIANASWPVARAQFGTTAASHTVGTATQFSVNGIAEQVRVPVQTDGSLTARYLFTWDTFYTSSFVNTGLTNHKTAQIGYISAGKQYIETNASYAGPLRAGPPNPEWDASGGTATNVASFHARFYAQSTTEGARQDAPGMPLANPPFIMKPSRWTRMWVLVEANAEDDATKFAALSSGRAPLASAISDTTSTSISVDVAGITTSPFTACPFECAGVDSKSGLTWAGRAFKIDNEIMTLVACTVCTGTTRTLTVVRGAQGSTPATHTAGTQVQLIEDYVTVYIADEQQEPLLVYDRVAWHIPLNSTNPQLAGSMYDFWIEFNTSTSGLTQGRADAGFRDLVAYERNLVVLKDPPSDWSALRIKPVR